jgi:prolyl-tRNA synthetase
VHRWSTLFIPTLREAPADAEVTSHKLLLRAGYVRQLGAGIYSHLFLGARAVGKIVAIIREEMDTIGQEFHLPALNPREVWEESGRWAGMGENMFRLKDRKGAELCLAMTHEEIMTSIARSELRSYKQLPQIWYQIQTKFRDEPRPKSGLLRVRQFLMKDAYSFDIDEAGLDESYRKHDEVYRRIFTRCGLEFVAVEADSGSMGGSQSQEFMVYTDAGEDLIASSASGYAANVEKATSRLVAVEDLPATGDGKPELVHTPGQKTIEEVGAFLGVKPVHQMKTMAYMASYFDASGKKSDEHVVVFLRGDHSVNETKLLSALQARELRTMTESEIGATFKSPPGYLGPTGLHIRSKDEWGAMRFAQSTIHDFQEDHDIDEVDLNMLPGIEVPVRPFVILDKSLEGRSNLIAGANKKDHHLRNVTPGRDFAATLIADVRSVNEGEPDPLAGEPLKIGKAVEIGHIFKLGYKYSKSMGASVLNRDGKEVTPIMGSYGIGVERILTAAIEQSAGRFAAKGQADIYALPPAIAPFAVVVTVTNIKEKDLADAGERIARELDVAGIDVLLDDRDERAGVKFKDAELIGVPFRIAIGKKLAESNVELLNRLTGEMKDVAVSEVVQHVRDAHMKAALS